MPKLHAILSDLHRLLSTYQSEDFLEASRYTGLPSSLKDALISLATEARLENEQSTVSEKKSTTRHNTVSAKPTAQIDSNGTALAELILRSEYGASNASIVNFARSYGLKLETRAKESRERAARRLAGLIQGLPDTKRKQVSTALIERTDSQTQGWINVIKGSKR
jgi:hypothetical protein